MIKVIKKETINSATIYEGKFNSNPLVKFEAIIQNKEIIDLKIIYPEDMIRNTPDDILEFFIQRKEYEFKDSFEMFKELF